MSGGTRLNPLNTPTVSARNRRWAPGDTLPGRLQRGTGAGYLQALNAPRHSTRELLLQCITSDPRWDRQLDTRADYYASLAQSVELAPAPLAAYLRQAETDDQDAPVDLTIQTLGALGQRGDLTALAVLRDYLTWGASWESAFSTLIDYGSPESLAGLDQWACDRFPDDDELMWQVSDAEPWLSWAHSHPRIAAALNRLQAHRVAMQAQRSGNRFAGLPVSELFEHASRENWSALFHALRQRPALKDVDVFASHLRLETPWHCKLALHGLGVTGGEAAFSCWKQFIEENPEMPRQICGALFRMTRSAPNAPARETGRAWFNHPDELLRRLGQRLLEQSATQDDLELLLNAIVPALDSDELYRLCAITEALAHIGSSIAWEPLARAFAEAPYSYARGRIANALSTCAPDRFTEDLAPTSLWDCEEYVREIACSLVNPEAPEIREKLTALAADPHEEDDVRKAATRHLATLAPQSAG